MSATTQEVELLRRDVHPAEVAMPDGTVLKGARVFVTSRRLLAYRTHSDGSIYLAFEDEMAAPCSVPASRATLGSGRLECRMADGQTVWVNRGAGCGCGSPLKALAPPAPWTQR